jgi:hypothetical protein
LLSDRNNLLSGRLAALLSLRWRDYERARGEQGAECC